MTDTAEPTPTTTKSKKAKFTTKEKKAFFAAYNETLGKLAAQFPGLSDRAQSCRPLKIGVHKDLAAAVPDMTPEQISMFCQVYTSAPRYRASLIEGAARVDLSGQPATARHSLRAPPASISRDSRLARCRLRKLATQQSWSPMLKPN